MVHLGACADRTVCRVRRTSNAICCCEKELNVRRVEEYLDVETEGRSGKGIEVLTAIKFLHTAIWAFLAASILVLPVLAGLRRFRWAAILSVIVLLECGVLAVNGGRCPLSDLAARFTVDRNPDFDIYLPSCLAQHNKVVFGVLFGAGELVVLGYWLKENFASSLRTANRASEKANERDDYHAGV